MSIIAYLTFALTVSFCYIVIGIKVADTNASLDSNSNLNNLRNSLIPSLDIDPRLLQSAVFSNNSNDLPVVIIRLDDVQAWYCKSITKTVINAILGSQTPLSIGVIGRYLDDDEDMSSYLSNIAANDIVEMVSHSFTHEVFKKQTVSWQSDDMKLANNMIRKVTGTTPRTFIPPLNLHDNNTILSAQSNQLSIISAQCSKYTCPEGQDVVAPNIKWNGIAMMPAGAVLGGNDYWSDYTLPTSVAYATEGIELQISKQGFSVLMLHPQEFTQDRCESLDEDKMAVLMEVIEYGKGKWYFSNYQKAVSYFLNESSSVERDEGTTEGYPRKMDEPVFSSEILLLLVFAILISCVIIMVIASYRIRSTKDDYVILSFDCRICRIRR